MTPGFPHIPEWLPPDWAEALQNFDASALNQALAAEYATGATIYPPKDLLFEAFRRTPLDNVRAVWLGQD
ncbi:MAG: hypothetical protein IKS20_08235, partial [Victivallales bacterium]|nr:hypothetical protein [Victivallales bacterium]